MATASGPPSEDAPLRVLIVEDNADLATMLVWLLRNCGFDVRSVLSGNLALDAARCFRPHFILLDIGLPGLDGYQVAELIRSDPELSKVVIIAVSAYSPHTHSERFRKAGFNHYLAKPVQLDDLLPLLVPRHG
jgi:CheY-like chemotaxis protein